nr:hypothetical protein [Roseobacter litoralis]
MFTCTRGAQLAVEAFNETVLPGPSGRDVVPVNAGILNPFERIAMLVNSVPLSDTIVVGMPRSVMI